MKKISQIFVLVSLMGLLVFGSTAKEFVHLFAHHQDTIHNPNHICPKGEAHIDEEHHHCEFLHFLLSPFANDAFVPQIDFLETKDYVHQSFIVVAEYIQRSVGYISLRGPPLF